MINLSTVTKTAQARGVYALTKASKHCDNALRIKEAPEMKEAIANPCPRLSAYVDFAKATFYFGISKLAKYFSGK